MTAHTVEAVVRRSFVGVCAVTTAVWTVDQVALIDPPTDTLGAIVVLGFLTVTVVLGVVAWTRRPPTALLACYLVLAALALVTSRVAGSGSSGADETALLVVTAALAPATLLRRGAVGVVGAVVVGATLVEALGPHASPTEVLSTIGPGAATAVAALLVRRPLDTLARRADESAAQALAALVAQSTQEAELAAHREGQAILHDQVLSALRTLGDPGASADDGPVAAMSAWTALAAPVTDPRPVVTSDLGLELTELAPTGLDLVVHETVSSDTVVSADVLRALRGSVGEALRNVVRHAGTPTAEIALVADERTLSVTVRDHGHGFETSRTEPGHGLTHSIVGRARVSGGAAHIVSAPGSGTRVHLTWPLSGPGLEPLEASGSSGSVQEGRDSATAARHLDDSWDAVAGAVAGAVVGAVAPFAVLALGWGVLGQLAGQPRWLPVWATVLVAAAPWVGGSRRRSDRRHLVALQVLALGGTLAFLISAPTTVLTDGLAWPVSLAALVGAFTALRSARSATVAHAATLVAMVLTFALTGSPELAFVEALPALASCCWPAVIAVTLHRVLTRLGRREADQLATAAAATARARAARRQRLVLEQRLAHLRELLRPTLGAAADGDLVAGDPATLERARRAEAEARDELRAPWLLTPAVRERIRVLREQGARVTLSNRDQRPRPPVVAGRLLEVATASATHVTRLSLVVLGEQAPVVLSVSTDDAGVRADLVRALREVVDDVADMAGVVVARSAPQA